MTKKTIRDIDVRNRRVLVRVDFNVPIEQGVISDDTRILVALPTLRSLIDRQAMLILCSHLGRPKGKPNPEYTLGPVAQRLSQLLGKPVPLAPDCIGSTTNQMIQTMQPGDVLLLENLRFHAEEEANDTRFARELAAAAEIYVNDAFGAAHRAHASTASVAKFLPAVSGLLMERELICLGKILDNPIKPFIAILGGAKISDKIAVIDRLLAQVDQLLIGGGMANTFLKAQDYEIGSSLVENDKIEFAKDLIHQKGDRLILPVDVVVGKRFDASVESLVVNVDEVPKSYWILDVGPRTIARFTEQLAAAKTIIWNGPMGVFEFAPFASGTISLARKLAELTNATTVIGGGDSAAAVKQAGVFDQMTHVSTGGGASLQFLEGKELPGVATLQKA